MFIDYTEAKWCSHCREKKTLVAIVCPDCGYRVRSKGRTHRTALNNGRHSRYFNKCYCARCERFYPRLVGVFNCLACGNSLRMSPDNKNRREQYQRQLLTNR